MHALEQLWHAPPTHADIVGQLEVVQLVQPVTASSWQACRWPWALHTAAPWVQTLRQQVAVVLAIELSAVVSAAELLAT